MFATGYENNDETLSWDILYLPNLWKVIDSGQSYNSDKKNVIFETQCIIIIC